MPTELIKECIGKMCEISLSSTFGIRGRIVSIEGNWIKVLEKDTSRLLNGDYYFFVYQYYLICLFH